jgi:hypothetical protein
MAGKTRDQILDLTLTKYGTSRHSLPYWTSSWKLSVLVFDFDLEFFLKHEKVLFWL